MVKNCHGFIPKNLRPRPSYYKERNGSWSAGFIEEQTGVVFEVRVWRIFDKTKGDWLHIYNKVDGVDWEYLEGYKSIKSAMERIREELDLPPQDTEKPKVKFNNISKWM